MASVSLPLTVSFSFAIASSTGCFSASETLSPSSPSAFSLWKIRLSAAFLVSTASLAFLSSEACISASRTAFSMSSLLMLLED